MLTSVVAGCGGRSAVPAVRAEGERGPLRALAARPHDAGRQGRRHPLGPLHPQLHRRGAGAIVWAGGNFQISAYTLGVQSHIASIIYHHHT